MAGISSIGVGSGIDLEGLVQNLLAAEAGPTAARLNLKEATIQAQISAFGSVKSVLAQFQSSLDTLKDAESLQSRSASSSDVTLFTATADNSVAPGSFAVQVLNLAKAQKLASADFADPNDTVGSGTLTISAGGNSFNVTANPGDTLSDLNDAINAASGNDSVTATLLTVDNGLGDGGTVTKLVLSAQSTGSANEITISVDDDDGLDFDAVGLSRFAYASAGGGVERLAPDGNVFTTMGFGGSPSVTDITDDPDAADATFLVANNKNADTSVRVSFPTPSDDLATGAGLQEIRVAARETAGSGTGTPTVNIEIYEAGNPTPLFTSAAQNVVGTGTQVFSFSFDASILADISGADIEVVVNGNRSGGPASQQSAVDIGAVEFNADVQPPVNQLVEIESAKDARITVDGFTAVSSTNVFADVVAGVTITAQREPVDPLLPETETLSVALNTASVEAAVQGFVESYNEVLVTLKGVTGFNAETGEAGALNGDATIRNLLSRFRSIIGDSVTGTVDVQNLAELGFRTERDGSVSIDGSALSAAISENFEDISTLFASQNGIANRLDALLEGYLQFNGILSTRTNGFDQQLARIEDQRDALDRRLVKIEDQFRTRFSALDALVAQLQSSGDFLLAQLENTASIITRSPGGNDN